jgi:hypothetical protein
MYMNVKFYITYFLDENDNTKHLRTDGDIQSQT